LVETRPSLSCQRCDRDRYAGKFPRELLRKHGIANELAKQTKSELFRDLLPLLNSSRIVLPRNDRLLAKSLGVSVAPARLAGTPSRIPTVVKMTWRMPLPARQRSPNSADTTRACAGCRTTTTGLRRARLDSSNRNLKVLDKLGSKSRVGNGGSSDLNHHDDGQPLLWIDQKRRAG
jgi:hypothetical protein